MNDSQGGAPSTPFRHRPVKVGQKFANKQPRRPPHLYGLESTTSALILSILGLCASSLCASSAAHCLCLHLMSSFSSSRTRSFSSSTVAIGGAQVTGDRRRYSRNLGGRGGDEEMLSAAGLNPRWGKSTRLSATEISCQNVCALQKGPGRNGVKY